MRHGAVFCGSVRRPHRTATRRNASGANERLGWLLYRHVCVCVCVCDVTLSWREASCSAHVTWLYRIAHQPSLRLAKQTRPVLSLPSFTGNRNNIDIFLYNWRALVSVIACRAHSYIFEVRTQALHEINSPITLICSTADHHLSRTLLINDPHSSLNSESCKSCKRAGAALQCPLRILQHSFMCMRRNFT